jgi:hypothetical protein
MGDYARLQAIAMRLTRGGTTRPRLDVPDRLNRNSARVSAVMPPEQAGLWLLERMRQQIGLRSTPGAACSISVAGSASARPSSNRMIASAFVYRPWRPSPRLGDS